MARWRAEALRRLPELRKQIDSSDQIMAFWIEATMAFKRAYERKPPDESLIARIYYFADWCVAAPRNSDAGHDPSTAAVVAFYEEIPKIPAARLDMPRWIAYDEFVRDKAIFSYFLDEGEYQKLLRHMDKNRHLYQPRARQAPM